MVQCLSGRQSQFTGYGGRLFLLDLISLKKISEGHLFIYEQCGTIIKFCSHSYFTFCHYSLFYTQNPVSDSVSVNLPVTLQQLKFLYPVIDLRVDLVLVRECCVVQAWWCGRDVSLRQVVNRVGAAARHEPGN